MKSEERLFTLLRRLEVIGKEIPIALKRNDLLMIERINDIQTTITKELVKYRLVIEKLEGMFLKEYSVIRSRIANQHSVNKILLEDYDNLSRIFYSKKDRSSSYNKDGKQLSGSKFCAISA